MAAQKPVTAGWQQQAKNSPATMPNNQGLGGRGRSNKLRILLVQKLDSTSPIFGLRFSGCVRLCLALELAVQKMDC